MRTKPQHVTSSIDTILANTVMQLDAAIHEDNHQKLATAINYLGAFRRIVLNEGPDFAPIQNNLAPRLLDHKHQLPARTASDIYYILEIAKILDKSKDPQIQLSGLIDLMDEYYNKLTTAYEAGQPWPTEFTTPYKKSPSTN